MGVGDRRHSGIVNLALTAATPELDHGISKPMQTSFDQPANNRDERHGAVRPTRAVVHRAMELADTAQAKGLDAGNRYVSEAFVQLGGIHILEPSRFLLPEPLTAWDSSASASIHRLNA